LITPLVFGSLCQIKLAIRQLLDTRKYSIVTHRLNEACILVRSCL